MNARTPDGVDHDGDDVGHEVGALLGGGDDELVDDGEGSGLDLPLSGSLDLLEEDREEDGGGPRGGDLDDGLDGGDGGGADGHDLVGEGLGNHGLHDLLEEEGLDGVSNARLDEDRDQLASSLAGNGVLLVVKSLLDSGSESEVDKGLGAVDLTSLNVRERKLISPEMRAEGSAEAGWGGRARLTLTRSTSSTAAASRAARSADEKTVLMSTLASAALATWCPSAWMALGSMVTGVGTAGLDMAAGM